MTTLIKGHDKFNRYIVCDIHGILKAHEEDIDEKIKERLAGGTYAFASKDSVAEKSLNVTVGVKSEGYGVSEERAGDEIVMG